jgi:AraC-like DNA-binding protein
MKPSDILESTQQNVAESMIVTPGSPLSEVVRSFWYVFRDDASAQREIIVPKGVVELIFTFHDDRDRYSLDGQKFQSLPRCSLNGYFTRPIHVLAGHGRSCFGVVLSPTAVRSLFRIPAGELLNTAADITLLDTSVLSLWHRLFEQTSFETRVLLFTEWVYGRMQPLHPRDKALNKFLNGLSADPGSVEGLSEILCYSSRQLSRKMIEHTGMNSREFLRYARYLKGLQYMHVRNLTGAEIAHACHFFDQAHFSKVFKSYTSFSPVEYKTLHGTITGHISLKISS